MANVDGPLQYSGDFERGGSYCLGFGGHSVDRRITEEVLRAISPLGIRASLEAAARMWQHEDARAKALGRQVEQAARYGKIIEARIRYSMVPGPDVGDVSRKMTSPFASKCALSTSGTQVAPQLLHSWTSSVGDEPV